MFAKTKKTAVVIVDCEIPSKLDFFHTNSGALHVSIRTPSVKKIFPLDVGDHPPGGSGGYWWGWPGVAL